jgi:hypothetical protein
MLEQSKAEQPPKGDLIGQRQGVLRAAESSFSNETITHDIPLPRGIATRRQTRCRWASGTKVRAAPDRKSTARSKPYTLVGAAIAKYDPENRTDVFGSPLR